MKKNIIFVFMISIISILFCACSEAIDNTANKEEEAVIRLVDLFFGEIKETLPENRDIDKIFEMIHYENDNEQFYEIRKDSFQNKDITDYKIVDIVKLYQDFYGITIDIASSNDIEQNQVIYVAKIDEEWKMILGTHNIPMNIIENLEQNNIEIPTTTFPDEVTKYPLEDVVYEAKE